MARVLFSMGTLKKSTMKNLYILFASVLCTTPMFAQISTDSKIRQELVDWDPVRGAWLAESMQAIATDQVIPERRFPEEFTPAEMFSTVPANRQKVVQDRIVENRNNAPDDQRQTWSRMDQFARNRSCNLTMARSYGDPHISTFDGKKFSFQTVGEFVMAKSIDGNFEVQARQRPQSDEISLNTAAAMNVHGDRVAIYASDHPDAVNGTPLRVNGQPIFINNETYFLPRGGTVQNNGKTYIVTWPTGEKVEAKISSSSRMNFLNLSVNVYPCSNNYNGVLGNANGNPNDDFGERGRSIASSNVFDPFGNNDFSRQSASTEKQYLAFIAKDFAREHRVTQFTTLFDYGFGQSTWTFTDESFPRVHLTLADMSENDRNNAKKRCEQQGVSREDMNGCIFDVGHANIEPTPRPVIADRTIGREIKPVDGRTPNVNKPEMEGRVSTPINVVDKEKLNTEPLPITKNAEETRGTSDVKTSEGPDSKEKSPSKIETVNKENVKKAEPVSEPVKKTAETVNNPVPLAEPITKTKTTETVKKPEPVAEPVVRPAPVVKPASVPASSPGRSSPVLKPAPVKPSPVLKPSPTPEAKPVSTPVQKETPKIGGTSVGGKVRG